ncbi:MAG: rRNA pseudouridine synthase [Betaproteobacteria bacterium]
MSEPVRLAKRLVEMVSCSRREAEIYIESGWVSVDGKIVLEPQFRVDQQEIKLHADAKVGPIELVTLLYHQLSGNMIDAIPPISFENRVADESSGIRPLKRHFSNLKATSPLQQGASGLQVYTQDWRVMRKLVDDAATVEQEYIVEVDGKLGPHGLKQLNHGLSFNTRPLPPAKVSWQSETRLRFALKGVQQGQIAHVCESVGLKIRAMKRIRIGKVAMAKLPLEQWRYLPAGERF